GRLAEAYTGSSGSKTTDVAVCYSVRGEVTDVYESTPHSGGYYHTTAAYFANGALSSLGGIGSQYAYSYGLDGEGRPKSATQGTTTLISNSTYNPASQPLVITLAKGDTDTYTYNSNTGRMATYTFTVGSTPKSMVGTLTWNANGTLRT